MVLKAFLLFAENLISGTFPFLILIITGVYLTVKGGFFQFSKFPKSVSLVVKAFKCKTNEGEISSYRAACTAISATVGTGNIAGVAGALSIGGAGAIFWMWISALCGMAVKFGEIALAIIFREKQGEKYRGGPMYYIKNGLPKGFGFLSILFAVSVIPAVIVGGNMTQTNASVTAVSGDIKTRLILGIVFGAATAVIMGGGIKRIGAVTEKLVPLMSVIYVIMSVVIIALNIDFLPTAFKMIIEGAFNPRAVTGGAVGSVGTAMMIGASRGVFSNEAGLGTSAMAHSAAFDADSNTQGLYGIFEVFIDTILLCTLTALTILCSRVNIDYGNAASTELVRAALETGFGGLAKMLLAVMMCVFGFSSVIGWAVYGDISSEYLFGKIGKTVFKAVYPLSCILGAVVNTGFVWRAAAFFNGIMLCLNLPAILMLNDNFLKEEKYEKKNRKFKKGVRKG